MGYGLSETANDHRGEREYAVLAVPDTRQLIPDNPYLITDNR
jgi:hypothetical protein